MKFDYISKLSSWGSMGLTNNDTGVVSYKIVTGRGLLFYLFSCHSIQFFNSIFSPTCLQLPRD